MHEIKSCDRETAKRRLTARWKEQVDQFPLMRRDIPLAMYISANLQSVMRFDLLASYDKVR